VGFNDFFYTKSTPFNIMFSLHYKLWHRQILLAVMPRPKRSHEVIMQANLTNRASYLTVAAHENGLAVPKPGSAQVYVYAMGPEVA
jgi:hypothetical protein